MILHTKHTHKVLIVLMSGNVKVMFKLIELQLLTNLETPLTIFSLYNLLISAGQRTSQCSSKTISNSFTKKNHQSN